MKENEPVNGSKESLEIQWPSGDLPPDVIANIVNSSHHKPLREIIARQIVFEGDQLWRTVKPSDYDLNPNGRNINNIAINEGYSFSARTMLAACNYFDDRDASVSTQIRRMELLTSSPLPKVLGSDLIEKMHDAVASLTKDPTGLGWLNKWLKIQEGFWSFIHEEWGKEIYTTSEDPGTIGFRKGVERYKEIYRQAIRAGAKGPNLPKTNLLQRLKSIGRKL